jgi:type IV pilus assembly protein PilM
MSAFIHRLANLIEDPPPTYVFELSPAGIAMGKRVAKAQPEISFHAFPEETLRVSPVADNVLNPAVLERCVREIAPPNGTRRREAALILPDYCARVALLDFDSFPSQEAEQQSLVRFRLKKSVPFDLDAASVSFQIRDKPGKKLKEVLVAAASHEIVARYDAPFRAAGFHTGLITTSMLASMDLLPRTGLHLAVKLSGGLLSVAVCEGRSPRLLRCLELPERNMQEIMGVLYPTMAYAEDELPQRPGAIHAAGFGAGLEELRIECEREFGIPVEPLRSLWGPANGNTCGLLGFLQASGEKA